MASRFSLATITFNGKAPVQQWRRASFKGNKLLQARRPHWSTRKPPTMVPLKQVTDQTTRRLSWLSTGVTDHCALVREIPVHPALARQAQRSELDAKGARDNSTPARRKRPWFLFETTVP